MVCFCKHAVSPALLARFTTAARVDADIAASASLALPRADLLGALSAWLASKGLPAPSWTPDEAWLDLELPTLALDAGAVATLSAFAQLRAQALAVLGVDLLVPAQATPFLRLIATLTARLDAAATLDARMTVAVPEIGADLQAVAEIDLRAMTRLAAAVSASARVEAALALGIFGQPGPPAMTPPLATWRPFLARLRALLPIIAAALQLEVDLSADISAQFAAKLRVMLSVTPPASPALTMMLTATASLAAVATLRAALGIDPLSVTSPVLEATVRARVDATAAAFFAATGFTADMLPRVGLAAILEALVALLPRYEYCASLMATPAVVTAALAINAPSLAAITWKVPAISDIPVLAVGLPAVAFTAGIKAALGIAAVLPAPCGGGCDAAAVLRGVTGPGVTGHGIAGHGVTGHGGVGAGLTGRGAPTLGATGRRPHV